MKLKIVIIDFELSPRVRRWALRIGIPAVVLGVGAVAFAGVMPLHTWNTGDILDAGDLNGNFANLQGQIMTLAAKENVWRANVSAAGVVGIQTGSWISTVSHAGPGTYDVTFASGVFTVTPTCLAIPIAGDQVAPSFECYDLGANGVNCQATASGEGTWAPGGTDTTWSLVCVGD
jgi:hypothetical protein